MYTRYTNVTPDPHPVESSLSSSTVSNPVGTPKHAGHQFREVELSESASTSCTASSSRSYEATTIKYHAARFTLVPAPAISTTEITSSWATLRSTPDSFPELFALGISSTPVTLVNERSSSQRETDIPLSSAHASTRSTMQPFPSSVTSAPAPAQSTTVSPVNIGSARRTGIIIGSVLGGSAAVLLFTLAFIYAAWRRRQKRRDKTEREGPAQQRSSKAENRAGNATGEPKRSTTESPITLPSQGAASPRALQPEPILVGTISPMTPIMPHLSSWTSEKADVSSPAGHPAIDIPPHLRHHPLFADRHHGHHDDDDDDDDDVDDNNDPGPHDQVHHPDDVSPISSVTPSPSASPSPSTSPPVPAAAAAAENAASGGFLFFDSPSSRSSRRPSTRDSSAPRTALSMPPAPALPVRSAARSKSLHDDERPAVWI